MRRLVCLLGLVTLLAPAGSSAMHMRIAAITIAPGALPAGTNGTAYNQTLTASGGTGPYTYATTAGSLPPGIALSNAGVLSGTPTSFGNFAFTVTATDATSAQGSQAYTLSISPATISITPTSLLPGDRGYYQQDVLVANGGTAPYTFAVTSGTLPAGLVLDPNGTLWGTPGAAGSFAFTVTATDANSSSGSRSYVLNVNIASLDISPPTLGAVGAGVPYTALLTASGGTAPYTFALSSGSLPPGLSLASNGSLTGTASQGGAYTFTVKVTDATAATASRTYNFSVTLNALTVSATLANGTYGTAYDQGFSTSGGSVPYTYALAGGLLPPGLALSPEGRVTGTPTAGGTFSFSVTATDKYGSTGTFPFTIVVKAPTILVTPDTLFAATSSLFYSATLTASGGVGSYAYTLKSGTLPPGLTLSNGGVLSGAPNAAPGLYTFTVLVTDTYGSTATKTYTVQLATPTILLTSFALPVATAGTAYHQTLSADGGSAPYSYSLADGVLPSGMSLSHEGTLSGTPTTPGTYLVTVKVVDANGVAITQSLRLVVEKPAQTVTKKKPPAKKKKAKSKHH